MEITYDQGSECTGHEFIKSLIELEYGIVAITITLVNPMSNAILERIYQVLGNLVWTCNITQTYVDTHDPWSVILTAAAFAILSTLNRLKGYSPGHLIFLSGMILWIKHTANWELIRQQKQTQMNKYNIHEK